MIEIKPEKGSLGADDHILALFDLGQATCPTTCHSTQELLAGPPVLYTPYFKTSLPTEHQDCLPLSLSLPLGSTELKPGDRPEDSCVFLPSNYSLLPNSQEIQMSVFPY